MQCATIEYARQVSKIERADSTEFDPSTPNRVIYKLRELLGVDEMGGTMRLGAWPCRLEPGSFAAKAYGTTEISERHRHRYEFNCEFDETLTRAGFRITGRTPDGVYVEIVEIPDHPWFLGCQFHPGVQIEAAGAASALRGVHPRQPGEPPPATGLACRSCIGIPRGVGGLTPSFWDAAYKSGH